MLEHRFSPGDGNIQHSTANADHGTTGGSGPSPDAALGDGDGAARHPYQGERKWETFNIQRSTFNIEHGKARVLGARATAAINRAQSRRCARIGGVG